MSIHHIYSEYQPIDPDTQIRHMVARRTWKVQPWADRGVPDQKLKRMWREEGRSFPYVKDVFDLGTEGLGDEEIAVYTNADICVVTGCCAIVAAALQERDAVYAYRIDFGHQFIKPIPDADVTKGTPYPGSDLYAFRVKWWHDWRDEFPDLLIAFEGWDPCIRTLIEQTQDGHGVEIKNVIYHQSHPTFWQNPRNRYRLQAQKYNINTECSWLTGLGVDPRIFGLHPI